MGKFEKDPVGFDFLTDKFGILGTSILLAATLFRVLFMSVLAIKYVFLIDIIIILLMILFYVWRRLLK